MNCYAKRAGKAGRPLQKGKTPDARVTQYLTEIRRRPVLVRSFLQHPAGAKTVAQNEAKIRKFLEASLP